MDRTGQDKTGQDGTVQDGARQNRTELDKAQDKGQDTRDGKTRITTRDKTDHTASGLSPESGSTKHNKNLGILIELASSRS